MFSLYKQRVFNISKHFPVSSAIFSYSCSPPNVSSQYQFYQGSVTNETRRQIAEDNIFWRALLGYWPSIFFLIPKKKKKRKYVDDALQSAEYGSTDNANALPKLLNLLNSTYFPHSLGVSALLSLSLRVLFLRFVNFPPS